MSLAIRTRNLVKEYEDVRALDGLDLSVDSGEFFGLLGPNGAGKTTFINVLVGLVNRTGGEASVFGYDVESEYRQARDAIGLAPQEFNVDRFFPIHEVLEHKAGYHGIPPAEASRRAEEALRTVGIYDKRDTRFDWLSGGMKRRFVLARALVSDPDLLILDEPTAGVDVELRRDLWDLITDLNDDGTTILLTTHYIEEAERLCDRVAIMDEGRKVEVASPDELMDRGTDQLSIGLRNPPTTPPALELPDVRDVRVEDGRLLVTATRGSAVVPEVIRRLEAAGFTVSDLDIKRASLEDVFVDMTRTEDAVEA
ncbi:ABC transporter ATP-binding protein [Halorientalis litorea]|jgi:ABC-2 type transport system ATP-binding protein|uniref:ABC transporter ATP-binding protein n=1 Tax=Halorientalis litorea TaxID=2931977 RepID=UPI001FF5BD2A|nr:ABC transporter ATP-binding protein [Halorientalis litorea]